MVKYAKDTKYTELRQQMPVQDFTPEVDRQNNQNNTLGMDETTDNRNSNKDEKMYGGGLKIRLGNLKQASPVKPSQRTSRVETKRKAGHGTRSKETLTKNQSWDTQGERWRRCPQRDKWLSLIDNRRPHRANQV